MDLIYNSKYYDSKLEKEIDFKYRTELTLQQKVSFVNFVLGVLFDDDYCFSIIKNEVFDIALIYMFTDVLKYEEDFTFSLNNIEEMLNTTNVIEILKKEIDNDLIKDLNEVIDINIAYKTVSILHLLHLFPSVRKQHINKYFIRTITNNTCRSDRWIHFKVCIICKFPTCFFSCSRE